MTDLIINWLDQAKLNWKTALAKKNFAVMFVANFGICFILYMMVTRFLYYNRVRPGTELNDPVLALFKPMDLSWPIFILLYSSIILFLVHMLARPQTFIPAVRAFLFLFVIRAVFIYLVPLNPPAGLILLKDPFIDNVIGFKNQVLNDLFFSGHIADLSFFIFCCTSKKLRYYLVPATIAVAIMLLIQRAHYTADVLTSPMAAYFCYSVFVRDNVVD
jgi:hypothetical protein